MDRLAAPVGGAAVFALTAGLACDNGGFDAVTWGWASILLGGVALVLIIVTGGERPGRYGSVLLAALALLTAWTAASWLWSDSPPLALVEAQRVALYLFVAVAASLAGKRIPLRFTAAGVVAGTTVVAVWNLVIRIAGTSSTTTGSADRPVGYANSIAFLCVLGLLLLPMLPRVALALALPLGADLVIQHSTGAFEALGAAVLAYVFLTQPRARLAAVAIAICGAVASSFALHGHVRTQYWHVAVREARADPVLGSGAGTFRDAWLRDRTVTFSTLEAHSLYLETLAELGPIGLALLFIALAVPLAAAVRLREPVLAAALVSYDVAAAVDFHWELAGATAPVIVLAAAVATHARRGRTQISRRVPAVVAIAVLTVAAILGYAGNVRLQQAKDALAAGDAPRAGALAHAALRYAPFSAEAWKVIGDAESSAAAYRRAIALDRNDWSLWSRLAGVTQGAPRRLALREAARLNPLASGP